MNNIIGRYKNGNYITTIFSDGTKIRANDKDVLIPEFPESMDMNITEKCDGNCPMCYLCASPEGKHGDILNIPFLDTIHPYTEIAINGNDLTHPDLVEFLRIMREKKIIVNMTVNQKHFMSNLQLINHLVDESLIHGLGVSLVSPTEDFLRKISKIPNAVIHIINGVVSVEDISDLANQDLKILILGYKDKGRGKEFHDKIVDARKAVLYEILPAIQDKFKAISFDNLALEQLDVKRLLSEEEWNEFYMGNDGDFTMYVDMVSKTFSKNSLEEKTYPITDNIKEMFKTIKENR